MTTNPPPTLPYAPATPRRGLLAFLRPDPSATVQLTDPAAVSAAYRAWQWRVLLWSIVGYALFYFVRKNLSVAMPVMSKELGIGKQQLGLFLTLHGVLYGLSKFANGPLGDRLNARTFLATGLILSALTNVVFGLSSTAVVFGVVWMLNGYFQGMGFPPCARLMTHWFPPRQLATRMSVWNTSHSIGAGLIVVLCGYLAVHSWRLCFLVPAALALTGAVVLLLTLPDTPRSVGLPDVEGTATAARDDRPTDDPTDDAQSPAAFAAFVRTHVFGNPYIWVFAVANFFVYTIRFALFDWGPTLLSETRHVTLPTAGWMVAAYEVSGIVGMLTFGWLTDRLLGGRGARACLLSMLGCTAAIGLLWLYPGRSLAAYTAILCLAGFFIYGPQALVGIAVANIATKRAAATAVGLTGIFGYASTVLSGWGFGLLVHHHGWNAGFAAMLVVAVLGALCFALAWPAKAHGYATTH